MVFRADEASITLSWNLSPVDFTENTSSLSFLATEIIAYDHSGASATMLNSDGSII